MNYFFLAFTLIEMLIVTVLIGIIAAVAYPSYTHIIQKTHRTEAKIQLLTVAANLEQFFALHHFYETPKNFSLKTEFYVYQINLDKDNYEIFATPIGPQHTDSCGSLSINSLGQRHADGKDCW